jgi:hypothetical protein
MMETISYRVTTLRAAISCLRLLSVDIADFCRCCACGRASFVPTIRCPRHVVVKYAMLSDCVQDLDLDLGCGILRVTDNERSMNKGDNEVH